MAVRQAVSVPEIRISDDLALPLDWMVMATVVYGARGSGKTTLGRVVAEELVARGQRFVAVDLKGDWWGLKATADGAETGIPVVIFGGEHADLPLEDGSGALVGAIVAEHDAPFVVDLERMSKGRQVRWLKDFFLSLYDHNRRPLMVLADEIQRYAPQRPMSPDETMCLAAVEDVIKLGRKHGLGILALTQRGAGLNKEISELCDVLVALRTPGPLDQDRIKDWLDANTTRAQRDTVMSQLAKLPTGTAIVASGHPDIDLFTTTAIRRSHTFDSSATPKVGQAIVTPKLLARVDLEAIREQLGQLATPTPATKGESSELEALRAKVAELERDCEILDQSLASADEHNAQLTAELEALRKRLGTLEDGRKLRTLAGTAAAIAHDADALQGELEALSLRLRSSPPLDGSTEAAGGPERGMSPVPGQEAASAFEAGVDVGSTSTPASPVAKRAVNHSANIPGSMPSRPIGAAAASHGKAPATTLQRRILDELAAFDALGLASVPRVHLAAAVGYAASTKTYLNAQGALRSAGAIVYCPGERVALSADAWSQATPVAPPDSLDELHERWCKRLGGVRADIICVLTKRGTRPISRDDLAGEIGYAESTKAFRNALGSLRTLGLVVYDGAGSVAASGLLFPPELSS